MMASSPNILAPIGSDAVLKQRLLISANIGVPTFLSLSQHRVELGEYFCVSLRRIVPTRYPRIDGRCNVLSTDAAG
jgi:hypothetical protein